MNYYLQVFQNGKNITVTYPKNGTIEVMNLSIYQALKLSDHIKDVALACLRIQDSEHAAD